MFNRNKLPKEKKSKKNKSFAKDYMYQASLFETFSDYEYGFKKLMSYFTLADLRRVAVVSKKLKNNIATELTEWKNKSWKIKKIYNNSSKADALINQDLYFLNVNHDLYLLEPSSIHSNKNAIIPSRVVIPGVSIQDVVVCSTRVFVLSDDGKVYARGENSNGQLGLGHKEDVSEFKLITALDGVSVIKIISRDNPGHLTLALTKCGQVYAWGCSKTVGQWTASLPLGLGKVQEATTPQKIPELSKVTQLIVIRSSAMAITAKGDAYVWGENDGNYISTPEKFLITNEIKMNQLTSGGHGKHTVVLLSENGVAYFPSNKNNTTSLAEVEELKGIQIKKLAYSDFNNFALSRDGKIYAWGVDNRNGLLGLGHTEVTNTPTLVIAIDKVKELIVNASNSVAALTEDNKVYVWGNNTCGELGLGNNKFVMTPTEVVSLRGKIITQFIMNANATLALTDEGRIISLREKSDNIVNPNFKLKITPVSFFNSVSNRLKNGYKNILHTSINDFELVWGLLAKYSGYKYKNRYGSEVAEVLKAFQTINNNNKTAEEKLSELLAGIHNKIPHKPEAGKLYDILYFIENVLGKRVTSKGPVI